jgi:hypothetical protein
LAGSSSDESKQQPQQYQQHAGLTSNHHFTIVQKISFDTNTTVSILHIHNFNSKFNTGKYKCQYKGLSRAVRVYPMTKSGKKIQFFIFLKLL